MSLVTRCPSCGTAFRARPAQLSSHHGHVRCGNCGQIFDGLSQLVAPNSLGKAGDAPGVDLDVGEPLPRAPVAAAPEEPRASAAPLAPEPVPAGESAIPPFAPPPKRRSSYSLLWGLLALLMLAALAAQAALYFRVEIVARYPALRIYVAALCEDLGCTVRLPHRSDLMSIESSDLQADPRREGLIQFNAVLRNRANLVQEYPSLELTLTDERDQPVLRRVLEPTDYLEARRAAELIWHGMAPGAEISMRLYFDIRESHATGYRLYLFYH